MESDPADDFEAALEHLDDCTADIAKYASVRGCEELSKLADAQVLAMERVWELAPVGMGDEDE